MPVAENLDNKCRIVYDVTGLLQKEFRCEVEKVDNKILDNGIEKLHNEVMELEGNTLVAIKELEEKFSTVELSVDWEVRDDVIDIFTMEQYVPLSESIRQIIV